MFFTVYTVSAFPAHCSEGMCSVGSNPWGDHSQLGTALVLNVYWRNIDTLRSHFLVYEEKMLLECHTKWGVGEYPPCTSFPSVFRGLNVYCWVLSVCCLYFIVCRCLSLNYTGQDILFWNGKTRSALIGFVVLMVLIEYCHCAETLWEHVSCVLWKGTAKNRP